MLCRFSTRGRMKHVQDVHLWDLHALNWLNASHIMERNKLSKHISLAVFGAERYMRRASKSHVILKANWQSSIGKVIAFFINQQKKEFMFFVIASWCWKHIVKVEVCHFHVISLRPSRDCQDISGIYLHAAFENIYLMRIHMTLSRTGHSHNFYICFASTVRVIMLWFLTMHNSLT